MRKLKNECIGAHMTESLSTQLGQARAIVDVALARLEGVRIIERMWQGDHSVWKSDPKDISNRLGWLDIADRMSEDHTSLTQFAQEVREQGYTKVLLLGMGGSSLAPEFFKKTFGVAQGYPDLDIIDTTDPGTILQWSETVDFEKTLWVVATKSGGTVETLSLLKFFFSCVASSCGESEAGQHFVAITDPGSRLDAIASEWNFKKTFYGDPNIGGRYSALSPFGLVPAALVGMDIKKLLGQAKAMMDRCGPHVSASENPGAVLGTVMSELARSGRDKLTLLLSESGRSFGDWIEQLVAESIGKEGKGILPVVGEPLATPSSYGADRFFVCIDFGDDDELENHLRALQKAGHPTIRMTLDDRYDFGGQLFLWEFATAMSGHWFQINPFDQPNVEAAKVVAREKVTEFKEKGTLAQPAPTFADGQICLFGNAKGETPTEAFVSYVEETRLTEYISIHAYLRPTPETTEALDELRTNLRDELGVAVTVGYGPRFLHSTGQLHKGDAGHGVFIQFTANDDRDVTIPDEMGFRQGVVSFGVLKTAQALGDYQALLDAGRKVIRVHLGDEGIEGIRMLSRAVTPSRTSSMPPY